MALLLLCLSIIYSVHANKHCQHDKTAACADTSMLGPHPWHIPEGNLPT